MVGGTCFDACSLSAGTASPNGTAPLTSADRKAQRIKLHRALCKKCNACMPAMLSCCCTLMPQASIQYVHIYAQSRTTKAYQNYYRGMPANSYSAALLPCRAHVVAGKSPLAAPDKKKVGLGCQATCQVVTMKAKACQQLWLTSSASPQKH